MQYYLESKKACIQVLLVPKRGLQKDLNACLFRFQIVLPADAFDLLFCGVRNNSIKRFYVEKFVKPNRVELLVTYSEYYKPSIGVVESQNQPNDSCAVSAGKFARN